LHILPKGFVRIRFSGFLAHRRRAHDLPLCRAVLASRPSPAPTVEATARSAAWPCPHCGGAMILIERLTAYQIDRRAIVEGIFRDTS
jgi:transposase